MTTAGKASRDLLGIWCGGVLVAGAGLTPIVAWLGPLAFAPVVALMGLLSLPALRLRPEHRPIAVVLLLALVWAAVSSVWSPWHPKHSEDSTVLKLALELPLYWSAVCGARRATPGLQRLALRVLAWGTAALGVLMLAEAATGGAIYRTLHERFYEPIRPDLAGKNLGQTCFVLALLWPLAAAGAQRTKSSGWLALPMIAGLLVASFPFKADAPALAVILAVVAGLAALRWPTNAPRAVAGAAAVLYLAMPALVLLGEAALSAAKVTIQIPLSYAMRVGYWNHALQWLMEQPIRGWGLDASRAFSPGIALHPHNGPLQVWLELGVAGALLAAAFWWLAISRLAGHKPDVGRAAALGSAVTFLLFGGVNFGFWQEWWLALGALTVAFAAALGALRVQRPST